MEWPFFENDLLSWNGGRKSSRPSVGAGGRDGGGPSQQLDKKVGQRLPLCIGRAGFVSRGSHSSDGSARPDSSRRPPVGNLVWHSGSRDGGTAGKQSRLRLRCPGAVPARLPLGRATREPKHHRSGAVIRRAPPRGWGRTRTLVIRVRGDGRSEGAAARTPQAVLRQRGIHARSINVSLMSFVFLPGKESE
ncbi:hypothetical protein AAFF_G00034290 [Aldrovandia affinis]|uniref:Uncharacterized protein n=1 Tax=Aldrovandia affinis TaxID=143900 RepID=A0AAD7S3Q5_9TELE|nr:hypothetical protein AAFF_G00034290 [Aldrovandia affinis]